MAENANRAEITFLGGLGEVGRNCTAVEIGEKILVIDCGVMFPPKKMGGGGSPPSSSEQGFLLPNFAWLAERKESIEGVVLTHGHLDHIGGLPELVKTLGVTEEAPLEVSGTRFTLALALKRLLEFDLQKRVQFRVMGDREIAEIGSFRVETFPVSHSIPDASGLLIRTPAGLLLHSGDFKLPTAPDGRATDLGRLREVSGSVSLALVDSTNALEGGVSGGEQTVEVVLDELFAAATDRRIVVSTFSSNVHRVQTVVNLSRRWGRRVCLVGSSLRSTAEIAEILGFLHAPGAKGWLDTWRVDDEAPGGVTIICTGAQGEESSALFRMSRGDAKMPTLGPSDTVVLSASTIPGNEGEVRSMLTHLRERGVKVVTSADHHVHVSGHACVDELREFHEVLSSPHGRFVPVHGTEDMLRAHGAIAMETGLSPDRLAVLKNGDSVVLSRRKSAGR